MAAGGNEAVGTKECVRLEMFLWEMVLYVCVIAFY